MGRVAIVTGASRGIGLAISKGFLANGVSVIGVARSHDALLKEQARVAAEDSNAAFIPCAADITTAAGIERTAQCLAQSGLALCALINNAGVIQPIARIADVDIEQWRRHFEANVTAVVALTQRLLPVLRENNARVVNVSSGAASHAYAAWAAYCASKAAVNMITQSLAVEEPEIVALAIRPGVVDTDMQETVRSSGVESMRASEYQKFKCLHESGGLLPPEKPAYSIVRLALGAPKEISGGYYSWDSLELAKYLMQ
ncbi:hypothetical protein H4S06_003655 [Coemansia sp. BCRC 34490]|nr:hypothetical protein H4S06_003655 [Coemansia sp. BCRC 34490]